MAGSEKAGGKLISLITGLIGIVVLGVVLYMLFKGTESETRGPIIVVSVGLACTCLIIAQLISRLPACLPGTSVSAKELGDSIGSAIDAAFSKHLPQPERYATAVSDAAAALGTRTAEQVEKLNGKLLETQSRLLEALQKAEAQAVRQVDETKAAMAALAGNFKSVLAEQSGVISKQSAETTSALASLATQFKSIFAEQSSSMSKQSAELKSSLAALSTDLGAVLSEHSKSLSNVSSEINTAISNGHTSGAKKIEQSLAEHADKVQSASQQLAAQLDKITELEQDIQKVLHVQEVVDGTIKSVTATEEFSSMLTSLRTHLEESDKVLREVSKPRKIRLVETQHGETA
ncbi:MAG: hypothetical protein KJ626_11285 [Verrucomicrobia bacterium]|nr:hypothetical protein [Verrucomicrobiota bacterium]